MVRRSRSNGASEAEESLGRFEDDALSDEVGVEGEMGVEVDDSMPLKDSKGKKIKVSYFRDRKDRWSYRVAGFLSFVSGANTILFLILFFKLLDEVTAPGSTAMGYDAWLAVLGAVAGIQFVIVSGGIILAEISAERQLYKLRRQFLHSVMGQEMGYFDGRDTTVLASQLARNTTSIRELIGTRSVLAGTYIGICGMGVIQAFQGNWRLALVSMGAIPIVVGAGVIANRVERSAMAKVNKADSKASAVASEALGAIRTVKAFSLQERIQRKYNKTIGDAFAVARISGYKTATGFAAYWGIILITFAAAFKYGGELLAQQVESRRCLVSEDDQEICDSAGSMLATLSCSFIVAFFLGKVLPWYADKQKAKVALRQTIGLYDRVSSIDPYSTQGSTPELTGSIVLENVAFSYPTRPEAPVFDDISLTIPGGKTTALIGMSGCGKSTVIQFLLRFYDVNRGSVKVCGGSCDIRDVNIKHLRDRIAWVAQEPRLFATTIAGNVKIGRPGATDAEVREVCKQANAHDFISQLPEGYDTWVGEGGCQLSGGQKQRIAIARALVKNPDILILDEATSALDYKSELTVQRTLDRLMSDRNRTVIVIAHRLSTIRNADKIVVFDPRQGKGAVVAEQGTHTELMAIPDGIYATLVSLSSAAAGDLTAEEQDAEAEEDDLELVGTYRGSIMLSKDGVRSKDGSKEGSKDDGGAFGRRTSATLIAGPGGSTIVGHAGRTTSRIFEQQTSFQAYDSMRRSALDHQQGSYLGQGSHFGQGSHIGHQGSHLGHQGSHLAQQGSLLRDDQVPQDVQGLLSSSHRGPKSGVLFRRTYRMLLKGQACWYALGTLGSVIYLLVWPVLGLLMGFVFSAYVEMIDYDRIRRETWKWMGVVMGVGVVAFVLFWIQGAYKNHTGNALVMRLRAQVFKQTLMQEMGFFDHPEHSPGQLEALLSRSTRDVKVWVNDAPIQFLAGGVCLLFGVGVIFYYSVSLGFVAFAIMCLTVPALFTAAIIGQSNSGEANIFSPLVQKCRKLCGKPDLEVAPKPDHKENMFTILQDVILNIRTVTAYNMQSLMEERYEAELEADFAQGKKRAWIAGICFGFTDALRLGSITLLFWYAVELVKKNKLDGDNVGNAVMSFILAACQVGRSYAFSVGKHNGPREAQKIYAVIDRRPWIDETNEASTILLEKSKGFQDIQFDRVAFKYPTRPNLVVYRSVTFSIPKGASVALVGASGCGKSTAVQLLERFYDVFDTGSGQYGSIMINGIDLREYSVRSLRSNIGLVSQEPMLFWDTVEENILNGNLSATPEEVEEACRLANASDFIRALPQGIHTNVGRGGMKLSGGQKQRIAIARALVRKPSLLILDEATSALDNKSEQVVQNALDNLLENPSSSFTTLIIAHRLSTIKNCDYIVVFQNTGGRGSRIAEVGNHDQLMAIPDGVYRSLVQIGNMEAKK